MKQSLPSYPAGLDSLDIPRANTQKNVNKALLAYLLSAYDRSEPLRVLDMPCGAFEWLGLLNQLFPRASLVGSDLATGTPPGGVQFLAADATQPFDFGGNFDLVTSISGIMMFGNTQSFIQHCCRQLKIGGTLVITNDNIFTVRDRLSFLFTGRVRRFKLLPETDEAISQQVSLQEVCRQMNRNGVEITKVIYTSFYAEDWLFAPLAIILYPFQWLSLRRTKSSIPGSLRRQMFPFSALLGRHYLVIGRKTTETA
ncbi:methyltransferase domain-containing protein [Hymenobacter sp. BT664]|uniref:Methyltransferase domain-containing protein n=1 Tax=Hymenobacter montanus TaxID=2771359 RepID=A0A927BEB2_9BACT|nr:methyltransferase domain-containing protein [Hymenobacter montanus]MBD2769266.1 methyltransferase domain-containing protein [Hymenobacter montanus]